MIPRLQVGPFVLKNVDVVVCENSSSLLGQTTLDRFDMATSRTEGVDFISLKLRPEYLFTNQNNSN